MCLFDILDLLAYFFHFRLDIHHQVSQLDVLGFGTNGIGFPIDFLYQKIQFASHRLIAVHQLFQLFQVAAQTDGFLRYGNFVGKKRGHR